MLEVSRLLTQQRTSAEKATHQCRIASHLACANSNAMLCQHKFRVRQPQEACAHLVDVHALLLEEAQQAEGRLVRELVEAHPPAPQHVARDVGSAQGVDSPGHVGVSLHLAAQRAPLGLGEDLGVVVLPAQCRSGSERSCASPAARPEEAGR